MMGININDCTQDFTGQILRGEKTIETRSTRSLDPYIGERVGLVRTGVGKATLVGYATIGEPVVYDSVAKFRRDYDKHLVAPGSAFDMKDRLKYGYPLMQVETVEPREIESRGIVARKVNPMTSDSEYLDAVRRGDMGTAQRMVDAAAKAAGFTIGPVYHGTQSMKRFNKFVGTWNYRFAAEKGTTYFTNNKAVASGYGVRVVDAYLRMINPLEVDAKGQHWTIISPSALVKSKRDGNDGVIVRNVMDVPAGVPDQIADVYVTFKPSQIKSADPVTYDDAGNVIPLSQRFNDQSPDIRNPRTVPKQFPYEYAAYLKAHFPAIWAAGGNIRGNDPFRWWTAYRQGDRSPTVMHWWNVTRPAWIARHYRDHRLPGVIAQIKWGTVGTLGVAGMKRVVEDAIRKRYAC